MKKLSKIVESLWADLQDRSSGDVIRKEDDVINHFDVYDFYDYIKSKYKSKIEDLSMGVFDRVGLYKEDDAKDILIKPYEKNIRMYVFYYDTKDISSIKFIFGKSSKWNLDILKKEFNLKPTGEHDDCNDRFEISERDGEITNQMVLNILDTLIDNRDQILKESLWTDLQDRSSGDVVRKEDGIKVHTCLDIDIVLKNPNCDYNGLIHDIIVGGDNEYEFGIQKLKDMSYTPDERVNVMKFGAPYDYLIYEGGHGTDLVATFSSYSELLEFNLDDDFEDEYCEEDYISICRGIATKVKEVGDCFDYVHYGKASAIGDDKKPNDKKTDTSKYEGDFVLELISENDVSYWSVDNDDDLTESLNYFKDDIIYEFPELEDTDFLYWNYNNNGGCFIAIPAYDINNILNIRKYREFTKKWFKS